MISLLALTGIFQPPTTDDGYTAVPMLSDPGSSSLFAFIMFPGAYDDVYEIASKVKFANIFLVPVSLNAQYVSDIHRLVTDLTPLKKSVKVIYPGRYQLPVNTLNQLCIIRGTDKCRFTFPDGFLAFDWTPSNPCCECCDRNRYGIINNVSEECNCDNIGTIDDTKNFHDIYVYWRGKGYLFTSTTVNKKRIKNLIADGKVDYAYVPYSYGCKGQDNFLSIAADTSFDIYMPNIIAYGFRNYEEFLDCYKNYRYSTPMTWRHLYVEDDHVVTQEYFEPIIGNISFCPSIFYPEFEDRIWDTYQSGEKVEEIIYKLPLKAKLPYNGNDAYEYKTVELTPGTNVIKRELDNPDIPFELFFEATQTKTTYALEDGKMNTVTETVDTEVTWEELNAGYFTPTMRFVPLDLYTNKLESDVNEIYITFFGDHTTEETVSNDLLYVSTNRTLTVKYLDLVPKKEEEDPDNPENPDPTNPDDPNTGKDPDGPNNTEDTNKKDPTTPENPDDNKDPDNTENPDDPNGSGNTDDPNKKDPENPGDPNKTDDPNSGTNTDDPPKSDDPSDPTNTQGTGGEGNEGTNENEKPNVSNENNDPKTHDQITGNDTNPDVPSGTEENKTQETGEGSDKDQKDQSETDGT